MFLTKAAVKHFKKDIVIITPPPLPRKKGARTFARLFLDQEGAIVAFTHSLS